MKFKILPNVMILQKKTYMLEAVTSNWNCLEGACLPEDDTVMIWYPQAGFLKAFCKFYV